MSPATLSPRAILYGLVAYFALVLPTCFVMRIFVAGNFVTGPGVGGNIGLVLFGSFVEALVALAIAPATGAFIVARTARRRVTSHVAITALAAALLNALLLLVFFPAFRHSHGETGLFILLCAIALCFAALGAWLGSRRQARLDDEQLMATLRNS